MTFANSTVHAMDPTLAEPVRALRVNGVELHYIDTRAHTGGGRPAAILLHGGMGDLQSWPHQVRGLSQQYRVIAYSRRHSHPNRNGAPQRDGFTSCVDTDVDDFLALQAALSVGPSHLIGTSYGALLALAVALRAPDRVASLVLAEPPLHCWACATAAGERLYGAFIDGVWRAAAEAFGLGLQRQAMQLLTDGMWGRSIFESWPDDRADAVMRNAAAMQELTRSPDPFPAFERSAVARLTVPTLLLQGEHTSALHRQVMNELGSVMRDAKRIEIAFAGHGSPNENPDAFNAAVVSFLESLRQPAGDAP